MRTGTACLIGIATMLASLVTGPSPASALDDVLGWDGTAWGMTESDVTTSMATRGRSVVTGRPFRGVPLVGHIPFHTKTDLAGQRCDVAFRFSDPPRGLNAVLIGATTDSPSRAAALRDRLYGALTQRHGAATTSDAQDRMSPQARWVFKTTTIALQLYPGTDAGGRHVNQVSVSYVPTPRSDQRETSDEGMLLTIMLQMLGKGRR